MYTHSFDIPHWLLVAVVDVNLFLCKCIYWLYMYVGLLSVRDIDRPADHHSEGEGWGGGVSTEPPFVGNYPFLTFKILKF